MKRTKTKKKLYKPKVICRMNRKDNSLFDVYDDANRKSIASGVQRGEIAEVQMNYCRKMKGRT